ncbi:MAG: hypothetical protein HFE04_03150 [Bacilli bacterium]|nr:hypothetical protein [Bacilli bacterium]
MNVDVSVIDNKSYIEVDRITKNGKTFVFLVNSINKTDFIIRKLLAEDGDIYYVGLDSNEEFDLALMYFTKKHEDILADDGKEG